MRKEFIENLLLKHGKTGSVFKRNVIKEYLQVLSLFFIYSKEEYQSLLFYGGSCLRHCFELPRLSEDLDFIDLGKRVSLENLAKDLEKFFKRELEVQVKTKIQRFRIYLKFPILRELKLATRGDSDMLFIKIEVFKEFNFYSNSQIQVIPIFRFNRSILIRTFDLPILMATKIAAILYRKWEKTDKKGKILVKVKGRDYFDLMWYLRKGIKPDTRYIEGIKDNKELREKLMGIIENLDPLSIQLDLQPLVEDKIFVKDLSKKLKEILIREISEKL